MTILLTEIYPLEAKPFIIFGADGRISLKGRAIGKAKKLLVIRNLRAGLGYFGLAEVDKKPMYQWLHEWCNKSRVHSLEKFAIDLANELNRAVPVNIRSRYISGIHIAGFGDEGEAEFWFVRNVNDDRKTIMSTYEAREDFRSSHYKHLKPGQGQIYRNGDIRAHVVAWERLDEALTPLLHFPNFNVMRTPENYCQWMKFKLQVVALFYKRFCRSSIIGTPVDVLLIKQGEHPVIL